MTAAVVFVVTVLGLAVYFIPWMVAIGRRHRNTAPIFLTNLLTGWVLVGWIVALIWSFTDNTRPADDGGQRPPPAV